MLLKLESNIELTWTRTFYCSCDRSSSSDAWYKGQADAYYFTTQSVGGVLHLFFGVDVPDHAVDLGECAGPNDYAGSATATETYTVLCDKYISVTNNTSDNDLFWAAYSGDRSGAGMPFQEGDIFYLPHKYNDGYGHQAVTRVLTGGGNTQTWSDTSNISASAKFYIPYQAASIGVYAGPDPLPSEVLASSCIFENNFTATAPDVEVTSVHNDRAVLGASGLKLYTSGAHYASDLKSANVFLHCPAYKCSYSGTRKNWDDTDETAISYTAEYDGVWTLELSGATTVNSNDAQGYDSTTHTITHDPGGLECRDIGQADFPFRDYLPTPLNNYVGYNDGRLDFAVGELAINDVLDINIPMSKDVVSFLYTDGWQVTAGGAATFSNVVADNTVRADVTADNTEVYCSYAEETLAGARYAAIVIDSDDTEPITIEMAGSQWDVTPGESIDIDLLAPKNRSGVDDTQTVRGGLDDTTLEFYDNYVINGLLPAESTDLRTYTRDGSCVIDGTRYDKPATYHEYTASKDTYVDAYSSGFTYTEVDNDDPAPSTPANHIRLAKVVTDSDNITSVVDLRDMNTLTLDTPVEVPWGWGVHSPGTIKFSGLRAGKYYNFKKITIRRHDTEFQVHLFRSPFVGDAPNHARQADERSLYQVGSRSWNLDGDTMTSTAHLTRMGVVLVDGVVAAELFGTVHVYVPSSVDPYWIHDHVYIDGAEFCYPSNGLVDFTVNTPGVPATWLGSGPVEVTGTTHTFDATGYIHSLKVSSAQPERAFTTVKRFNGRPYIRVVNRNNTPMFATLSTLIDSTSLGSSAVLIPDDGVYEGASAKQPLMDYVSIVSGSGSSYVISGYDRDYTGFTLYALDDDTPTACEILTHNEETGAITLSHTFATALTSDSEVGILLPYNYTLVVDDQTVSYELRNRAYTFATTIVDAPFEAVACDCAVDKITDTAVIAHTSIGGIAIQSFNTKQQPRQTSTYILDDSIDGLTPAILLDPTQPRKWAIAWGTDTATNITWSNDGFASGETSELMSGVSNVRTAINPVTNTLMVAGWSAANSGIVASISHDNGATLSTPVVVATAPENPFGLASAVDLAGAWYISYADANGDAQTVKSIDNGLTWTLIAS